ncbi:MAG: hypothetical protein M1548_03450 [Actinobacteria bacterium]|nr:hypothetical protein [Actinomycetota bacterium]
MGRTFDVNDEDIGIRTFQIRKQRQVERAIEKIRFNMGKEWQKLSAEEEEILEWALGEAWAMMGFSDWEHIGFSFMEYADAQQIILLAREVVEHRMPGTKAIEQIHQMLNGLSQKPED